MFKVTSSEINVVVNLHLKIFFYFCGNQVDINVSRGFPCFISLFFKNSREGATILSRHQSITEEFLLE